MEAGVYSCVGVTIRGSNITLEGEGAGSIIQCDGNPAEVLSGAPERPWTIPIAFVWPRQDPIVSDAANSGNILIKNLRFRGNVSPVPITFLNYKTDGTPATYITDLGTGSLLAFQGTETSWPTGIRIVNCVFEDANKSMAVYPSAVDDVVFEGCTFLCNKNYVSGVRVRATTTQNLSALNGLPTLDTTVALESGDRVMVKNQTDATQNGIYIVRASADGDWIRAEDADEGWEFEGLMVYVEEGSTQKQRIFQTRTNASPVILTTPTSPLFEPKSEIRFYEYFVAQAASSTSVTISNPGTNTFDSRQLQPGDLLLLYGQTADPTQNGVYLFNDAGKPLIRVSLAGDNANVLVYVRDGATHNRRYFRGSSTNDFSELPLGDIQGHPISFRRITYASQVDQSNPTTRNDLSGSAPTGVALATGDTFLLTNQTDPKQNGLYLRRDTGMNIRICRDEQRLENLHLTVEANAGTANPHKGWQFASMSPPNIEYSSSSAADPLVPLLFYRAHNFYWVARAASPKNPGETGSNVTRSGISSLDGVALKNGDIVLLKSQTTASENGAYRVRSGAWDPFTIHTNNGFGILVSGGATSGNKNNIFYNAGWVFATQTNKWYRSSSFGWPQIKAVGRSGSITMIGNYCDCDYVGIGGDKGSDGLFFHTANEVTVANGNTVRNFRFEAIQVVSEQTEIIGNSFLTKKGGATVAVAISPNATYYTEFSTAVNGNSVDGAALIASGVAGTAENLVDLDVTAVGNNVNASESYGIPPIQIQRGRKVTIANNKVRNAWGAALWASSCTTQVTVTVATSTQFPVAATDKIKTGERILFTQDGATPLPGDLDTVNSFYAKRISATRIEVYSNLDLTSGPLDLGASPVSCILHHRLNSVLAVTGNEITDPKPGWTSEAIHLNDVSGLAGKKPFGQTVVSENVLSARSKHIFAYKPLVGAMNFLVGENLYTTEQGVQAPALIDLTTVSGTVYGRYEIQGKVLNGAPNREWAAPIADIYVKDGKKAKLFSAAERFTVFAEFDPSAESGGAALEVELFKNYPDQRFRLLEIGFIRLWEVSIQPLDSGNQIQRIVVVSKNDYGPTTSYYIAGVNISTINALGSLNPKVAERDIYYKLGTGNFPYYCIGGFFSTGDGLKIVGYTGD